MVETQHLLSKVRPPRVQITYDVEIGDAIEMKELPFVVGVMADLSGDRDPAVKIAPVKERKFAEIDRDNFNTIMSKMNPRVTFQVENHLSGKDGDMMNLELKFNNIDNFDPVQVLKQVPQMADLYRTRTMLRDLLTRLDGNDELDELLTKVLETPADQNKIKTALKLDQAPAGEDAQPKSKK
jgi:type VI secretion system protein ImpB